MDAAEEPPHHQYMFASRSDIGPTDDIEMQETGLTLDDDLFGVFASEEDPQDRYAAPQSLKNMEEMEALFAHVRELEEQMAAENNLLPETTHDAMVMAAMPTPATVSPRRTSRESAGRRKFKFHEKDSNR